MPGEFKATLLREKFTLFEADGEPSVPSMTALSNRMVLSLSSEEDGEVPETFVVRTQNMHSCVRLCAAIAKEYSDRGAIMQRGVPFNWELLWRDVIKGYEKDWNPVIWCAIYHKGRVIYENGDRHPFLDIIEQCDAANREDYNQSVTFAEQAFRRAGKDVRIDHDSNVALIVSIGEDEARCGVILRGANKKTTFNFTTRRLRIGGEIVRVPSVLTLSAAFLEGIQLAFSIGLANKKREMGQIVKYSDEDRKAKRGTDRLINLTGAVDSMERKYNVTYRPDRPDFQKMVREAEENAVKILSQNNVKN